MPGAAKKAKEAATASKTDSDADGIFDAYDPEPNIPKAEPAPPKPHLSDAGKKAVASAYDEVTAYCTDLSDGVTASDPPKSAVATIISSYEKLPRGNFRTTAGGPLTNTVTIMLDANEALAGRCNRPLAGKISRALDRGGEFDRPDDLDKLDKTP